MVGKVQFGVKMCFLYLPVESQKYIHLLLIFFKNIDTHGNANVHSSGGVSIQPAVLPSANMVYAYIYNVE